MLPAKKPPKTQHASWHRNRRIYARPLDEPTSTIYRFANISCKRQCNGEQSLTAPLLRFPMQHALFYIWSHGTPGRLPVPPPAARMHRDPRPAGKSADGPEKSRSGGVSARCHAKVPPKDRIFWRTRGSRHGGGALTCGSPEPAARPIRPIDENPILWRDFCSGAGRPRHIPRRIRTGEPVNRSQT